MGRATVRAALTSFLQAQNFPYVGVVWAARPVVLPESAFELNMMGDVIVSDNGSGCSLVVNITDDARQRRALTTRASVNDTNIHDAWIEMFFANSAGDGVKAQQDYDTIIDAIFVAVRNNPTLSDDSQIWAAGEGSVGVHHSQGAAYTAPDGPSVFIPGTVRFQVWEWIAGTGV